DQAIRLALALAQELRLEAAFLCSDLYDLPQVLTGEFDIVFTSYGVLGWLPDLGEWARIIAHFLKPGGTVFIAEVHPFGYLLSEEYSYFPSEQPMRWESAGSYADRSAQVQHRVSYDWMHSMGDILNALISAGLSISYLHEYPYCVCGLLPCMEQNEDGWWRLK